MNVHSLNYLAAQKVPSISFSKLYQDQFSWWKCRLAKWEVHLALWDTLAIKGGTAWTQRSTATNTKKKQKTRESAHWQELQLALEGGIFLTGTRLPLIRKGKTRVLNQARVGVNVCSSVCVRYAFALPQLLVGVCLSPRGPSPGPESAAELCPLSTSPSPPVN